MGSGRALRRPCEDGGQPDPRAVLRAVGRWIGASATRAVARIADASPEGADLRRIFKNGPRISARKLGEGSWRRTLPVVSCWRLLNVPQHRYACEPSTDSQSGKDFQDRSPAPRQRFASAKYRLTEVLQMGGVHGSDEVRWTLRTKFAPNAAFKTQCPRSSYGRSSSKDREAARCTRRSGTLFNQGRRSRTGEVAPLPCDILARRPATRLSTRSSMRRRVTGFRNPLPKILRQ